MIRRWVVGCAVAVLLVAWLVAGAGATTADEWCPDAEELAMVRLMNQARRDQTAIDGVYRPALRMTPVLGAAAEHHSVDMATGNWFSHFWPAGTYLEADRNGNGQTTWSENMTYHGYTYNTWRGEDIAAGSSAARNTFTSWKNSPSHWAIILSPHFNAVGVGRAYDAGSTYKWYWTADFGGVRDGTVRC